MNKPSWRRLGRTPAPLRFEPPRNAWGQRKPWWRWVVRGAAGAAVLLIWWCTQR